MNKKFLVIMEYTWLVVALLAAGALLLSASRSDKRNVAGFAIITIVAFAMFMARRRQRKKS